MLFLIIMWDTIHSFVQKVSVTQLDIVYLTAGLELNLFNKINFPHEFGYKALIFMDCNRQFGFET